MENNLKVYAASSTTSKGRIYKEKIRGTRTEFQRDRDRVIHSSGFRRLVYKTQVFVNHEGDMYRTRLTHSLEVAQIGRTIARALSLNEDLVEAICLAHDLGHTPFGHAGQDALNECMLKYGGFEHNLQSLRLVDYLENKYLEFPGLNLTFETREGILKHCSSKNAKSLGEIGLRFINNQRPSLEAQIANVADEIAYNHHDIDDGLRSELIDIKEFCQLSLAKSESEIINKEYKNINKRQFINEIVRRMINQFVNDIVMKSSNLINEISPKNINDIRNAPQLIRYSKKYSIINSEIKSFLYDKLYNHPKVKEMTDQAETIIKFLFKKYSNQYSLMSEENRLLADNKTKKEGIKGGARVVCDYIAGMTDRYALEQYNKLNNNKV
ncbi:MAG: deoxyguanosinetriphosphate triphosphohydrolase [Pseudomonadota bacterium]|nr:deoxyguanosinetriphosphate triphosphohydrolase [Gammaproteobacteria bacterium]MEE2684216.1 deoxyguanosinetriphosphate triphosphohydrolase [Pseudomonadota bacterium]